MSLYIFDILVLSRQMSVYCLLWPLRVGCLLVLGLYKKSIYKCLVVCIFYHTAFVDIGKVWIPFTGFTSPLCGHVTPTDQYKSDCNRCVSEVCVNWLRLSHFFLFFWKGGGGYWCKCFCHKIESVLFFVC